MNITWQPVCLTSSRRTIAGPIFHNIDNATQYTYDNANAGAWSIHQITEPNELRNAIETIVYDALLAENTAAYSDDTSRAPSCADVTTKIMAAIEAASYTSEGETAAILADPDAMAAIAEGSDAASTYDDFDDYDDTADDNTFDYGNDDEDH